MQTHRWRHISHGAYLTLSEVFQSLAFMLIAVSTQAIMQMFGRVTLVVRPHWYKHEWFKAFVASQNCVWGIILAFVVDLPRLPVGERVLVGMVAGFLSLGVYEMVLKRFEATSTTPKEEC